MATIQDLREEYGAGTYWIDEENGLLRLKDIPTGGPLFEYVDDKYEHFGDIQVDVESFTEGDWTEVKTLEDEGWYSVQVEMDGVEHEFAFEEGIGNTAFPTTVHQGGESYSQSLEEIPEFVKTIIREEYDKTLVER